MLTSMLPILSHIPEQLAWATAKRGRAAHTVKAAYSSQECSRCHFVDRTNRANQQTFCCGVCGYRDHADHNASVNLARRYRDADPVGPPGLLRDFNGRRLTTES